MFALPDFQYSEPKVNFPLFLAPMVGLSHVGLRLLVRHYTPEGATTLWPTEMLNSRRLPSQKVGETPETFKGPCEDSITPQILGNEESFIAYSIAKLEQWGAVGVDINMGCPVKKALQHNYGVALMGDCDYASRVVEMAVRNTKLPVSVKLRAGLQGDIKYLLGFVKGIRDAGASHIILHPRTAEQKRRGRADWNQIRIVKEELKFPVIGNGDVQTVDDALMMFKDTGCDGVMIGRALTARPWLLWQIGERTGFRPPKNFNGLAPRTPREEAVEYGRSLSFLLDAMAEFFPEALLLRKFKFHVHVSQSWLNFGHRLEADLSVAQTKDDAKVILDKFFQCEELEMCPRTQLRY